jgi:hypothetical protein
VRTLAAEDEDGESDPRPLAAQRRVDNATVHLDMDLASELDVKIRHDRAPAVGASIARVRESARRRHRAG